jgi:hypothetical protein
MPSDKPYYVTASEIETVITNSLTCPGETFASHQVGWFDILKPLCFADSRR